MHEGAALSLCCFCEDVWTLDGRASAIACHAEATANSPGQTLYWRESRRIPFLAIL